MVVGSMPLVSSCAGSWCITSNGFFISSTREFSPHLYLTHTKVKQILHIYFFIFFGVGEYFTTESNLNLALY